MFVSPAEYIEVSRAVAFEVLIPLEGSNSRTVGGEGDGSPTTGTAATQGLHAELIDCGRLQAINGDGLAFRRNRCAPLRVAGLLVLIDATRGICWQVPVY